ncbi:hypothetical protein ACFQ8C_23665 [Streptomyces sp. NPDC056503]|uniref:hypothetical protein n=1 Tax=Streptomyces sp. NPDC056503 TaxID=3345842 RepID=UPI0036832D38
MDNVDLSALPAEIADPADIQALQAIEAQTGRSAVEMIREAIHKATLANRVWGSDDPFFQAPTASPTPSQPASSDARSESSWHVTLPESGRELAAAKLQHATPELSMQEDLMREALHVALRRRIDPAALHKVTSKRKWGDSFLLHMLTSMPTSLAATSEELLLVVDRSALPDEDATALDTLVGAGMVTEVESGGE